jgi:uncharacterized protein (DUF302 family)
VDAIETTTDLPMDDAEARVRASLAEEGFGILTEIDVAATLKTKLGVEREALKILGACNPTLAHRALELDPRFSLMMPCNVVLEPAAGGGTKVSVVDPHSFGSGPEFDAIASDAAQRISRALDALTP